MKVLIVDDSEIIQEAIQSWIGSFNLDVIGRAKDGKTALDIFRKESPDIVTLDITMPEMDGLTAMEKMLEIKPQAKIIIVSALAAKEIALSAIKKGAASYLVKPFTKLEIEEVFQEILEEK